MAILNNLNKTQVDTDVIAALEDRPQLMPHEIKARFDKAPKAVKAALDNTIDEMNTNINIFNNMVTDETGFSDEKIMTQKGVTQAMNDLVVNIGAGDMTKSEYDADNDGVVDNANLLCGMTIGEIMRMMNPIGTIKITTEDVNPANYIGGTWVRFAQGRMLLGAGMVTQANTDASFGSVETSVYDFDNSCITGGAYTHKLAKSELPDHIHKMKDYFMDASQYNKVSYGSDLNVRAGTKYTLRSTEASDCGGGAHNNMPPFVTCYMWQRTA